MAEVVGCRCMKNETDIQLKFIAGAWMIMLGVIYLIAFLCSCAEYHR